MKQNAKSEQPSTNASLHRLGFPSLSQKASESLNKEKILDLVSLPHWNESIPTADCSSAGRFFRQADCPKTARTSSQSSHATRGLKTRDTYIQRSLDSTKVDLNKIWEIAERVDSCKIRAESGDYFPKSFDNLNSKVGFWIKCSNEITTMIKAFNSELSTSLSLAFKNIFGVCEDYQLLIKETEIKYKTKVEELSTDIKSLNIAIGSLKKENSALTQVSKLEELKIHKEIEEMFPSYDDDIKRLKEESLHLRNRKYGILSETLEKLYNEMSRDQPIPEMSEIDISAIDPNEFVASMMNNYRVVVSTTVQNMKRTLQSKTIIQHKHTETEDPYIDPKVYNEICRQLEKMTLSYQSTMMLLDSYKEESSNRGQIIEKVELEKLQIKNETLQLKREIELLNREIHNLKLEIDKKKTEIMMIMKQNDEKTTQIVELENRIDFMSDKILNLSFDLERSKLSKPPSAFPSQRGSRKNSLKDEEQKKNKLDEVTKSGRTVREEFERAYANNRGAIRKSLINPGDKNLSSESQKTGGNTAVDKSFSDANKTLSSHEQKDSLLTSMNITKNDLAEGKVFIKIPDHIDYSQSESELEDEINKDSSTKRHRKNKYRSKSKPLKDDTRQESIVESDTINEISAQNHKKKKNSINEIASNDNQIITSEKSSQITSKKPVSKTTKNPLKNAIKFHSPKKQMIPSKVIQVKEKNQKKNPHIKDVKDIHGKDQSLSEETSHRISVSRYYNKADADKNNSEESSGSEIGIEESENYSKENNMKKEEISIFHKSSSAIKQSKYKNSRSITEKILNKPEMCDKKCGRDIAGETDIGIQVNLTMLLDDKTKENSVPLFLPYNPNNLFGLRGDVYYQKSSFQPQSRIPDTNSSLMNISSYKLDSSI
ncbi:hypothetical protein SteCoe_19770 [Stentor coeruleus]|uniref:Uncharacterized protein n=1 Tax=Stentor coeruleus TaxID=5963 RepID=A0A1R2BTT5_9CILI|nr:hypothetical protein SteCoe_19770 [Stentor coeruleus]